ncbi:Zinc finger protein ZPR1 [Rhodotorula toruloides]|uniref:BY PROTMAP: gi/472583625/gb/EMS21258.1/ zinc finger, ZPR1-type protein [Rhodosporidium toruloides NP11] gi/647396987/emb/CDR39754.1/ RHTO0S04e08724g1_1 [Rhodosporidium toruloides] n=1 Tax=Rhodotorula toruloides TaxID=5286 RepID=A0A0K3C4G0_RHOTO|nr:Zinc finger protein ZPR1 [Rhodotorula toruloides]PRQ77699.1 zinc-finger protein zpr1 [Rhodotorula toruloides]
MSSATAADQSQENQWKPIGAAAEETVGAGDVPVEVVESLCMQCHEQGETRMLLTVIPYFREVIVVSFRCEHCGYQNNEIQSAGEIQPLGAIYTVKCTSRDDLNRQLVKSESCTISIPDYQLTIPAGRGQLTTVEGVIADTIRDLEHDQPLRKIQHPDVYAKIEELVQKLRVIVPDQDAEAEEGAEASSSGPVAAPSSAADSSAPMPTFTLKLDDPSGNSFVETRGGLADPKWSKREYERDAAQDEALGLKHDEQQDKSTSHYPEEVLSFPGVCSLCGSELETLMKKVDIPHFKDIILMSTNCHDCGYRDTEVKSGGAIAEKGRRITLKVEDSDDLSRDILKSETAGLVIPEIDLELNPGTLGGRFTTLEGLLQQVYEELDEKVFARGDSSESGVTDEMQKFLGNLKKAMAVEMPFTVILDDPLSNSYIQNTWAPDVDPNLTEEDYERTFDQNDELGLNDIQTENYGHVEVPEEEAKEGEAEKEKVVVQA